MTRGKIWKILIRDSTRFGNFEIWIIFFVEFLMSDYLKCELKEVVCGSGRGWRGDGSVR